MYPWPAPLVTITLPPGRTTSMRRAPLGAWTMLAPPGVRTNVGWPEGAKCAELPLEPWNSGRGPGLPALFEPKLLPALLFGTGLLPALLFVPKLLPVLLFGTGPLPLLPLGTGPLPAEFEPKLLPALLF